MRLGRVCGEFRLLDVALLVLLASNAFVLVSGCDSPRVSYGPDIGRATEPLWADPTVFWNPGQVPVCWENPGAATTAQMDWVRQAIARTWSFAGNLEFTGWGTCAATGSGLRIRWQDDAPGPRATAFGTQVDGLSPGLILNNTFTVFSFFPGDPRYPNFSFAITCDSSRSTPAQIRECIENIAIHEFGHVLGFHHEQNAPGASSAPDFPASCPPLVQAGDVVPDGGVLYNNQWDLYSVMNYCSPAYGGPRLTFLDFSGMVHFFGISPRFVGALAGASII